MIPGALTERVREERRKADPLGPAPVPEDG